MEQIKMSVPFMVFASATVSTKEEVRDYFNSAIPVIAKHQGMLIAETKKFRCVIEVLNGVSKSIRISCGKKECRCLKVVNTTVERLTKKNLEALSDIALNEYLEVYNTYYV